MLSSDNKDEVLSAIKRSKEEVLEPANKFQSSKSRRLDSTHPRALQEGRSKGPELQVSLKS